MSTIDLVAQDADGRVLLVLVHDPARSVESLQQRVHDTVGYSVDGQLARDFPGVATRPVSIRVDLPSEPTGALALYLDQIGSRLAGYGIGLIVNLIPAVAD